MPPRPYVSISHVARRLGLEPDDVLDWIERGLLESTRTKAGYLRISREQLDELLRVQAGRQETGQAPRRCGHGCGGCCHARREGSAESAAIVQITIKTPLPAGAGDGSFRVLVVTESADIRQRLLAQPRPSRMIIEFALHGYECSALVGRFHPEVVVIDRGLPREDVEALCQHLAADSRVPRVKLVLVASGTQGAMKDGGSVYAELPRTFDIPDLEALA